MRRQLASAWSSFGLCIAAACIAACDTSPSGLEAGISQPGGGSLIVYGTTTSATTGAVAASVTVVAEDSTCSGVTFGSASGMSSSGGTYRLSVSSSSTSAGCVVVTGTVTGGTGPVSVTAPAVVFGAGDSVRVNLAFP